MAVAAEKTERLLALLLLQQLRGSSQREKAKILQLAGYSNLEIANLLETSSAVVAQNLYELRRAGGKKTSKAKGPKKK